MTRPKVTLQHNQGELYTVCLKDTTSSTAAQQHSLAPSTEQQLRERRYVISDMTANVTDCSNDEMTSAARGGYNTLVSHCGTIHHALRTTPLQQQQHTANIIPQHHSSHHSLHSIDTSNCSDSHLAGVGCYSNKYSSLPHKAATNYSKDCHVTLSRIYEPPKLEKRSCLFLENKFLPSSANTEISGSESRV